MKHLRKKSIAAMTGLVTLASGAANTAVVAETSDVQVVARQEESYAKIAGVQGTFSFQQDALVPADEVFSLFGTAAIAACAKPGFAFGRANREDYYVNINGKIKKAYTISLQQLEEMDSVTRNMMCSCAMGSAVVSTRVTGVPIKQILSMVDIAEGVNTITMKDAEGYGLPMPLSYVLEKDAMLVYKVGGQDLPDSQGPLQVWLPDTVARYFTRQVTDIELTAEDSVPAVQGMSDQYRAKVNILNRFDNAFEPGDSISFEGYADDCGVAIEAIEYSLDDGKTWTAYPTKGADPHMWVYWKLEYTPEKPGTYKLDVRARTSDGTVSPLGASVVYTVAPDGETLQG